MKYVKSIIARIFHQDVDAVLSGVRKSINHLADLESRKAAEAKAHEDAIADSNAKLEAAAAERGRAAAVRQRLVDLIS